MFLMLGLCFIVSIAMFILIAIRCVFRGVEPVRDEEEDMQVLRLRCGIDD
jgi:hypothetical protein